MCVPGTFEAVHEHHPHDHGVSRRDFLRAGGAVGAGIALSAALPKPALAALPAAPQRFVDLTHVLTDGFAVYPAFAPPKRVTLATADGPLGVYANQWTFAEHSGTHLDVPSHFSAKGRNLDDISLDELIMPAVVLDISARAANDADTEVGVDDLRGFEASVGRIPDGSAVLVYSGWDSRIHDRTRYLNIGPDGKMHAPGFSVAAADWLLSNRKVRCVGVDTISLDPAQSTEYPFHRMWMPADKLGLEVLANLKALPPIGATLVIGAIPFEKGSGGPGRIFAII
jgi:kynurenine formamidase